MKKTKQQKRIIRRNKMWPLFWEVLRDKKEWLLVWSRLTGEIRVLDKQYEK